MPQQGGPREGICLPPRIEVHVKDVIGTEQNVTLQVN